LPARLRSLLAALDPRPLVSEANPRVGLVVEAKDLRGG
jgi:hypothetical protein